MLTNSKTEYLIRPLHLLHKIMFCYWNNIPQLQLGLTVKFNAGHNKKYVEKRSNACRVVGLLLKISQIASWTTYLNSKN